MMNPNTLVKEKCLNPFFVTFFRPLFRDASGTLDKSARFSPLYRQDSNKLSNEDMLRLLADFRKLVKLGCLFCAAQTESERLFVHVLKVLWLCTHTSDLCSPQTIKKHNPALFYFPQAGEDGQAARNPRKPGRYHRQRST